MESLQNWLGSAQDHVASAGTACPGCSRALALRLSHLLLKRLGNPLAALLVGILPEREQFLFSGTLTELGAGDPSIGYPDFMEHASYLYPQAAEPALIEAYFEGVRAALPEAIAARVAAALPSPRPLRPLGRAG
jgi:hypothetical protein